MTKVLFVCLGNICRSPMAEGVMKNMVHHLSENYFIDSAGTASYHLGAPPDWRTTRVLSNYNIVLEHYGRQVKKADFEEFDYIIAMDKSNYYDLKAIQKSTSSRAKVFMLNDFDANQSGADVPDPYYGDLRHFEEIYEMINASCRGLIQHIQNDRKKIPQSY
jgi:protein-tyrosine phosphatase